MSKYNYLSTKGANLEDSQLFEYIKHSAEEHIIVKNSDKRTYPRKKIKNDFENILKTYQLLNEHLRLGINIHSAGEWLLDNFYVIEECEKNVEKSLTLKKYKKLPGLENEKYKGISRIYVLASDIVGLSSDIVSEKKIIQSIDNYQLRKNLSMEEIWNIGIFLQIVIIQKISEICEKIYYAQLQRYKVENTFERLVELKPNNKRTFKNKINNKKSSYDLNYSYVEYMTYKLRKIGKNGNQYIDVLEREIKKLGTTIDDIVQKEHLYIATLKIKLGTLITSLKEINRINYQNIFEQTNKTEELLNQDPSGYFINQTDETKELYREKIKKISDKFQLSEIYITEKILSLSKKYADSKNIEDMKKSHVGYYLIGDGKTQLKEELLEKRIYKVNKNIKVNIYLFFAIIIPLFLDLIASYKFTNQLGSYLRIIVFIFLYIPLYEINIRIINYVISKIIKSIKIPKLNFEDGIDDEYKTMVVMPCILEDEKKVKECFEKLEVYYLANKDKNIFFTLLGDCTTSEKKVEKVDENIIKRGIEIQKSLNEKYSEKTRFNFVYRKRRWNEGEQKYIGWERKRGLLIQFNELLINHENEDFIINTLEKFDEKIKYVITLDFDTNLVLDSAKKLIGAMAHILNTPVIKENIVVDGYGIMQPRIGISLEDSHKSLFSKIFSGNSGIDFYTNAVFDIYQDCFGEGIFTGKGIYDLEIYQKLLKDKLPENRILSHDLLEGNYLRCGLVSDVVLLDSFPSKYVSYLERENRWTRGDWQISKWTNPKTKHDNNPINRLGKYKIFDNLRRSILRLSEFIVLLIAIGSKNIWLLLIALNSIYIPTLLEIVNKIIFRKSMSDEKIYADKKFSKNVSGVMGALLRNAIDFICLPTSSLNNLFAILKTIYRLKKNIKLLEWKTSDAVDKETENSLEYYCNKMKFNIIAGILIFGFMNPLGMVFGTLWILAPYIMWKLSQTTKNKRFISIENKRYLLTLAEETWNYFKDGINKENNYLISDNYQLDRKNKSVTRTSSTNIGLEIMSIISATDMQFISEEEAISLLKKVLEVIRILPKWNGHLYNWYNIKTLEPLRPEYISTVDSGNFVGYLYVLKRFLINKNAENELISIVQELIRNTDFKYLYSQKNRLFSIGFDLSSNSLSDSYYDFLASESRQTSFVAIAKNDIKYKHWINLSRTLTSSDGYKGLISWSGTSFEYTMPNLIMDIEKGSLLDESCNFAKKSQIKYAKVNNIPWGISESAYSLKDLHGNYQYKAFGIPWLGLKRGLEDELVVSPYGSILFLDYGIEDVINNLKKIEVYNMRGKYGFFEAIDFTRERLNSKRKYDLVKTYMAHHQGLILNSINNAINNNILKKRFMQNPEIKAVKILLDERMPENVVLSKNKQNKVSKGKYFNKYEDKDIVIDKKSNYKRYNSISSDDYTNIINNYGQGYSRFKSIQINRYRNRNDCDEGIGLYFKNLQTRKIWSSFENDKVIFSQSKQEFITRKENIESDIKVFLDPNESTEIRNVSIKNYGILKNDLEVYFCLEPLLTKVEEDIAHPAYNNMFLKFNYLKNDNIVICSRKINDKTIFLGVKLLQDQSNDVELELNKERFLGRNNKIPEAVINSSRLTNEEIETVEPIIAFKTKIELYPNEEYKINYIISISYDMEELVKYLKHANSEKIESISDLAKAKSLEEIKFLELNGQKVENNQRILGHLIEKDKPKYLNNCYRNEDIWKFGISGDYPIILAEIRNINEIYLIDEMLETIEFFNVKNMKIDLIILNKEKNAYETIVKNEIYETIRNHRLDYLLNNQIFVINNNEQDENDINVLKSVADICFSGIIGGVKNNLDEIEELDNAEENIDIIKDYKYSDSKPIIEKELDFPNEIGGFKKNEYVINVSDNHVPPRAWCNVIANKEFGTITTENGGGYTWIENSRLQRITTWENDPIKDFQPEMIWIKDLNKKRYWQFGGDSSKNNYQVRFGQGYSKYIQNNEDLIQENIIFIPIDKKVKINNISIKNMSNTDKRLVLYYVLNFSLGEEKRKNLGKIKVSKIDNKIIVENICKSNFDKKIEIGCSEKIVDIFGGGKKLKTTGNILIGNELIIEIPLEIKSFEKRNVNILMGDNIDEFIENRSVTNAYENVEKYWNSKLSVVTVKTPSEKINLFMNYWLIYQTIACRINAKSGFYQSGGATGFRDQLQDCLGMKWIDINLLHFQIIQAAKHQFKEGDVLHWWHNENMTGIRTKISDDLLWLPYSVLEYIEFTNDYSILDEEIEYVTGIQINEEKEKYDKFKYTNEKDKLYKHCINAIEKSLNFGKNGFPKIGTGDWNDGFDRIGHKGEGESVWLGFFLYDILNRWNDILKYKKDNDKIKKYEIIKNKLKNNLNTIGWDGQWYRRAINDDGIIIGSEKNKECKIDSISQSWAVISDAATNDKKYIAIDSAKRYLVDEENKIIKLLTPAFNSLEIKPGYIERYPEGVRENGGQYTHSSIWLIWAYAKLGMNDDALKYIEMINPITHTENLSSIQNYKIEPYVIPGDIYDNKYMKGRGGWSWYTGSSSWYYKICLENILGLIRKGDRLYLPEKIPSTWDWFDIQYKYKSNIYNIKVRKKSEANKAEIFQNGKIIEKNFVELKDENKVVNIEIKM